MPKKKTPEDEEVFDTTRYSPNFLTIGNIFREIERIAPDARQELLECTSGRQTDGDLRREVESWAKTHGLCNGDTPCWRAVKVGFDTVRYAHNGQCTGWAYVHIDETRPLDDPSGFVLKSQLSSSSPSPSINHDDEIDPECSSETLAPAQDDDFWIVLPTRKFRWYPHRETEPQFLKRVLDRVRLEVRDQFARARESYMSTAHPSRRWGTPAKPDNKESTSVPAGSKGTPANPDNEKASSVPARFRGTPRIYTWFVRSHFWGEDFETIAEAPDKHCGSSSARLPTPGVRRDIVDFEREIGIVVKRHVGRRKGTAESKKRRRAERQ